MTDFDKIVNEGKQFACSLYKAQPGALIRTPFTDLLHQVWDNFCDYPGAPGLPPPPLPKFSGGQCQTVYRYVAQMEYLNTDFTPPRILTAESREGGFTKIFSYYFDNLNGQKRLFILTDARNGDPSQKVVPTWTGDIRFPVTMISFDVFRSDGLPDNCGNPPPEYPPAPPPPAGGYTSPPVSITFNDGLTNNYYFNFTPPSPPPIPALIPPPIIINYLSGTIAPEFNIPMTFNFNGTVNFGGGGGGSFNQDDRDKIDNINNTTNNTNNSVSNINNTTSQTKTDINNFINIVNNQPPKPEDYNPPKTPVSPGTYAEDYLAAVEITLTSYPKNIRSQEGGSAPDVLYAGWFEFMREGKALPREPIHFEKAVFVAPSGVDGYAFTLYTGVQGTAVAITKKEKV